MEELLHHLAYIKPCKEWDIYPVNWLAWFLPSTVKMCCSAMPWKEKEWRLASWSWRGTKHRDIDRVGKMCKVSWNVWLWGAWISLVYLFKKILLLAVLPMHKMLKTSKMSSTWACPKLFHPGVEDLIRELRQCQEEGLEVARLRNSGVWQHQMLSTSADAKIFRKCRWIQLENALGFIKSWVNYVHLPRLFTQSSLVIYCWYFWYFWLALHLLVLGRGGKWYFKVEEPSACFLAGQNLPMVPTQPAEMPWSQSWTNCQL